MTPTSAPAPALTRGDLLWLIELCAEAGQRPLPVEVRDANFATWSRLLGLLTRTPKEARS